MAAIAACRLGTTTRIGRSRSRWELEGLGLSANGRMLAYAYIGEKTGTCNIVIHDRATGRTTDTSGSPAGATDAAAGPVLFPPDGAKAVFACPTLGGSGSLAVVLWTPGSYTQLTTDGSDALPTGITDDGNEVSFVSGSSTLVAGHTNAALDLFAMNLTTHAVQRLDLSAAG